MYLKQLKLEAFSKRDPKIKGKDFEKQPLIIVSKICQYINNAKKPFSFLPQNNRYTLYFFAFSSLFFSPFSFLFLYISYRHFNLFYFLARWENGVRIPPTSSVLLSDSSITRRANSGLIKQSSNVERNLSRPNVETVGMSDGER